MKKIRGYSLLEDIPGSGPETVSNSTSINGIIDAWRIKLWAQLECGHEYNLWVEDTNGRYYEAMYQLRGKRK